MLRHGLTPDVVTALAAMSRAYRGWGGSAPVTHTCTTAASWPSPAARLQVFHRPGHSPSDTVFFDAGSGELLGRRPPDQAHLLEPADLAPLGGRSGEPGDGRPRSLRCT